jgi:tRNA (guanine-N7-)-methyltransferase
MHGYTLVYFMVRTRSLYANHNVYVEEGSPEEVTDFSDFYENNI